MKNRIYFLILSLALFLLAGVNSFAAFPERGTWAYQTVASGTTVNVTLTDDVALTGPIVIEKDAVLNITRAETQYDGQTGLIRITLASDFTVPDGCMNCMFWVKEGGTLNIEGINQGRPIDLKASYNGSLPIPYENGTWKTKTEYNAELNTALAYTVAAGNKKIHDYTGGGAIYAVGNVSLTAVRIYDAYSSGEGAAIYRPKNNASLNYTYGTIALNNTHIYRCVAQIGPAILIYNQRSDNYGAANDDSSCKVTLSNLTRIYNCVSRGGGDCGAIRTGGGVVGDLELTRTEIYNNMAYGDGAGIYWNAHGDEEVDTRLTMKQCRVYENKALGSGGGLYLEATFEFLKGTATSNDRFPNIYTDISDNIAEKNGGGICCRTYNAVKGVGEQTLDFGLNENVQVLNNSAVCGGGVAYEMKDTTSLAETTTLNMAIDGAVISGNSASSLGGGIYFRSNSSILYTNLIIDSGSITDNTAGGYGGGIYAVKGPQLDVSKSRVKLNGGTISGNTATNSGGGVSVYGLKVQCDTDADGILVKGNSSQGYYGGGIHLEDGASFTMNSGTVADNTSAECGGGVFVRNSEMIQNGGVISGNASSTGGGIWMDAHSTVTVNGGVIGGSADNKNTASVDGGGIYMDEISGQAVGNLTVNNGEISYNEAGASGGGMCVKSGVLTINGENATISYNKSLTSHGGGIAAYGGATITMAKGTISYNDAGTSRGGGLYAEDCTIVLSGGKIISNKTERGTTDNGEDIAGTGYGGGIYVNMTNAGESSLTLDGCKVDENSACSAGGVFVNGGHFDMKGGSISNNTAVWHGGAIYVEKATSFSIEDGTINSNTAGKQAGAIDFASASSGLEVVISGGEISRNQATTQYGGAVYGAGANITVKGGIISNNTAEADLGGAFYISKGNLTIEDGKIFKNTTGKNGGAINYNVDGGLLTITGGEIYENTSTGYGGGIHLADGALTIEEGNIHDNTSGNHGGGVYFNVAGSTLIINGGVISGNEVTNGHGGGIYCAGGDVQITDGEISGNRLSSPDFNGGGINFNSDGGTIRIIGGVIKENESAKNGGGIHVAKGNLIVEGESPCIQHNVAANMGGGIYYGVSGGTMTVQGGKIVGNVANAHGGGIYLSQGTLNLTGGEISGNSALATPDVDSGKGAGLYAAGSKAIVNIDGGLFYENKADYHGGAIYASVAPVTITGGEIKDNEAQLGAGVFIYASRVVMSGGNIIDNKAYRGGGVYLATSNANMTFGNGLITGNRASWTSSNLTTGYQQTGGQGFGGGVCVVAGTFAFDGASGVGLYNNIADKAGDDVFASGMNTTVTLPDVGAMNLSGYKTKTPELYWVEDYMNGDTGYAQGTYMNKAQGYVPVRYREAIANQNLVYPVPVSEGGQTFTNKYMALSLGYEIIYATLVRSGLLKGENAIYRVSRLDNNGTADKSDDRWTVYSELLLFGPEDALTAEQAANKSVSKRIALYSGTWKVEETGWAWTYDADEAIIHEITGSSSPAEKAFVFNGTKLKETDEGYVPAERYDESVVRNDFGNGTSETDKASPASESGFEKITDNGVSW